MKHKTRTKALSWLLSLAMVLSLLPGMSLTAFAAGVSYVDGSGTSQTADATILETDTTTWTDGSWYIAPEGGITISSRITVNGTVNLILRDGATLTASKGITVTGESNSLTIYGQEGGSGTLIATGDYHTAGIGSAGTGAGGAGTAGSVTINGGTVTANGGAWSAGIGGGNGGNGGPVTINGGTVTANGGSNAAGIGGGSSGNGGPVTINGGRVIANGGYVRTSAPGIGRGVSGVGGGSDGDLTVAATHIAYSSAAAITDVNKSSADNVPGTGSVITISRKRYMLVEPPPHTHSFTYTATGGDTITATCGADGCTLPPSSSGTSDHVATLTIAAPLHTTAGDNKSAEAQITDANKIKGTATVSYYKANNDNTRGDALNPQTTAPTDGGKYWAEITLGEGNGAVTAHVVYEIADPDYTITLPTGLLGGTVTAKKDDTDVAKAKYNDAITLVAAPEDGYHLTSLTVKDDNNKDVSVSGSDNTRTFTMPASAVTVSAAFEGAPYDVTVNPPENGTVTAPAATANAGSEVTLTVTPSVGYQLDALTVKDNSDNPVTVTNNKFTMPASAVTVSATFKEITYTVTANGTTATVTDSLPTPNTYTAELTGLPNDKTYDGEAVTLTAEVDKSASFPDKVTVGSVSFKDQKGNTVTTATDVGTYTASATVGDKTISKSFQINGQTKSITYVKTTKSGNNYTATLATTNQYIPLQDNPTGITLLKAGRIYYAEGTIAIGALVFMGDNVMLILGKNTTVTIYAGIYHIGSSLEIYSEQGGEASSLVVKGNTALSSLSNYSDFSSQMISDANATMSGTIGFYSGKLTVEKGKNSKLVADDISLTLGAGVSASGLTGGTANGDGTVLHNKESLSGVDKLYLEYKAPAANTTPSSGGGGGSSSTSSGTTTTTTTTDTTSNPDASTTNGTATVTTTTNRDGSTTEKTTETATKSGGDGSKTEVKAESTTTTKSNTDGTTTAATTAATTATTTAADGSKTVTETKTEAKETLDKSGNGTVEAKTTETVKDESGKVTATTVTESKGTVETATDGTKTTTTTNTAVTTAADGTKTTVVTTEKAVETTDGSTGKVVSDESGKVVSVEAKVSESAAESAAKSGETVTLPVTVTAAQSAADATAVAITVPKAAESVKVEIPVEDVKPGTVAVIVHEDGSEEIVKTSTTSEGGVVLALESGASVKVVDNTKDFVDVSGGEWYADNVAWASSREVMNGVGNNTFAPNEVTTTGMVAQILMNLSGETANPNTAAEKYSDIKANDWFAAPISWLTEAGIAQGEGDAFGATEAITRERDIVLLHNYAQHMGYDTSARADLNRFADAGSVSDWARDAMAWAVGAGIINGTTDGSRNVVLDPQGSATRAQVTAMTERFCKKTAR